MKALMKYPGSKWRIAKWIIDFFPDHHSYLEPFFGSGAILFNKLRSNIETVNDLADNDRLRNWHKEEIECYSRAYSKKREVIWMNYDPVRQMELELTD